VAASWPALIPARGLLSFLTSLPHCELDRPISELHIHLATTQTEDLTMAVPLSIMELEEIAKRKLDKMTWEYYYHGAAEEITRLDNVEAFNRYIPKP
jgi:hypothetical protein